MKNSAPSSQIAKTTRRHAGIDIFRIVATLMVIMLHTLICTPLLSRSGVTTAHGSILWLFETLCYCAVNCFAITSGFVSCQSTFKFSRLMRLWLEVFVIFIICTLVWGKIAPDQLDDHAYRNMFFPILADLNWYFTAFFGMSLFSPFMNIMMKNLSKNQHKYLVILILILFCIPTRIPKVSDLFNLGGGYSMIWLCAMYIVGGYFRLHSTPASDKRHLWLMGFFASGMVAWLYFTVVYDITSSAYGEGKYYKIFLSYTSPFMVLMAICLLQYFRNVTVKRGGRFISAVAALTFGVFIFHTQDLYWNLILETAVNFVSEKSPVITILGVIGIVFATFIICAVATYVLSLLFRITGLDKFCSFVHNKVFAKANKMLQSDKEN